MERGQRGLSLCCNGARITLQWCSRSCKVIKRWFENVACILAQKRRKSGLSWEEERVSQALHVFTEQSKWNSCYFMKKYWKDRKKLTPLLPSVNLPYALFLPLPLLSPLQQWEGGSVARQHPLTAGRPLTQRCETHRGTCPNLLEGQKGGATAQCQQKKSLQSNCFTSGGWERMNCFS